MVRIGLHFDGGRRLTFGIRFLFGVINIRLIDREGDFSEPTLKSLLGNAPILIPATPGPSPHEDYLTLATVHRMLAIREPSRVVRNVLTRIQRDSDPTARQFVDEVLRRYFNAELADIDFDEKRDLEIRSPLAQEGYSVDIVSSGSGLNQILQLASIIAWRKPSLVLLDEPDAHLHSSVQTQLFDFLAGLVERYGVQIILSTHSRDLISQAPLESIVPVDPSRDRLEPLKSLDHLLLEFQRYGPLSHVDLALLYQTKSCIFVEGPTDARLIPRIAERLGIHLFTGARQAVPFEFHGVHKLKLIPELVQLFERIVGGSLRWAVIRDSDSNVPEVKAHYQSTGETIGAEAFHQWDRHSLENYLLDLPLLRAAIAEKSDGSGIKESEVRALLDAAVIDIEDAVTGPFVTNTQLAYRDLKLSESPHDEGAAAATRYLRTISTLEDKLAAYPGKKIFGAFVGRLQAGFGLNLRIEDVVAQLTAENAPEELVQVIRSLKAALSDPNAGAADQFTTPNLNGLTQRAN